MNPDRLAELEAERRFLLHSLDDLEREYEAGDVDGDDYETLYDGYVSRAAAVLREIEQGRQALPSAPPRRRGRSVAIGAAVLCLAVLAGWLVARESGQRLPGQVATGGSIEDRPSAWLSQARALGMNDPTGTLELYDRVLAVDPDNVEALTYRAWMIALVSAGASEGVREVALARARADLAEAVRLDQEYADAWCFSGIVGARAGDPTPQVRTQLERCLAEQPPGDVRGLVQNVLDTLGE